MTLSPHLDGAPPGIEPRRAFGLTIAADLPLDDLAPAEPRAAPDLRIVRRPGVFAPWRNGAPLRFAFGLGETGAVDQLDWRDVGGFRVEDGLTVAYEPGPGVSDDLVTLPLLGTVMAVVLQRRRRMVLHGSAIALGGKAWVFVGDKGAGKSTTAAALVGAGRPLLTDDVVALEIGADGRLLLAPGYPQVKLTASATAGMALADAQVLPTPYAAYTKHRHALTAPFDTRPVELGGVFVLQRGAGFDLSPLTGAVAVQALMRFAYLARFGGALFEGENARTFLDWCGRVTRQASVARLEVPTGFEALKGLDAYLAKIADSDGRP